MDIWIKIFISFYWFILLLNNFANYRRQPAELKRRNMLIWWLILANTIVLVLTAISIFL